MHAAQYSIHCAHTLLLTCTAELSAVGVELSSSTLNAAAAVAVSASVRCEGLLLASSLAL
jgi:hypothetical protein